jgi:pSer/pThr/pTyr-binding forkhead associated (FHA) protein
MPSTVSIEGNIIDLIHYATTDAPYIVIETLSKDRNQAKVFHVLTVLDVSRFKVGRGHECDVRFRDISISRYHATIRYNNKTWYLDDNFSKFGTVV